MPCVKNSCRTPNVYKNEEIVAAFWRVNVFPKIEYYDEFYFRIYRYLACVDNLEFQRAVFQIREMESEEQGMSRDVLADAAQMTYEPHSGIAVYIDYLTPTFHISANLTIAIIK